jgi:hypothetical protein
MIPAGPMGRFEGRWRLSPGRVKRQRIPPNTKTPRLRIAGFRFCTHKIWGYQAATPDALVSSPLAPAETQARA